ncbi:MAG: hypothetical protein KJ971_01590 [Firmicutes bacterium]|nr:hypothetical protein [Bacillota bacterium]
MDEKDISHIEEVLGYTFTNKALLTQAFTRSAFSSEPDRRDSEVLEFVGDRVIEYQITRILVNGTMSSDNQGLNSKYNPGELTILKSLIVENANFASVMEDFGLDQFIPLGQNEVIQESFKSDLLESIVGAIAVDSFFNENELYEIVDYLLSPRAYLHHSGFDSFLYVKRWCKLKKVKDLNHSIKLIKNGGVKSYRATIKFGDYEVAGTYETKIDSLFQIALLAHKKIRENKEEITIKDFLHDLNENNGKSKLNELKRLGFYKELDINDEKTSDNKWKITFQMDGFSTWYVDANKKKAMKICSLFCINSLLSRSFRIDSYIKPFLVKLGYME